jgi:hypothetical protein
MTSLTQAAADRLVGEDLFATMTIAALWNVLVKTGVIDANLAIHILEAVQHVAGEPDPAAGISLNARAEAVKLVEELMGQIKRIAPMN